MNYLRGIKPGMKTWIKGLGVLAIAVVAIGVNVAGFMKVRGGQQTQNVDQIATSIVSQQKQLTDLEELVKTAYIDESKEFLQPNLKKEDIDKMENGLSKIKVSAEDFGVSEADLPEETAEFAKKKDALQATVREVVQQFNLQVEVQKLFTNETIDFQNVTNDVIMASEVTETQIDEINEKVTALEKENWQANVQEYLSFAQAQLNRVQELEGIFSEMIVDGNITESATYDMYYYVADSVSQVRNPDLKAGLLEQLEIVSQQLGMGSVY